MFRDNRVYLRKNIQIDVYKRQAFTIAKNGRPGPVLVDITKDVTAAECEYEYQAPQEVLPQTDTIREEDIEQAEELIRKAQKPFILVGGGAVISGASEELRAFAKTVSYTHLEDEAGNVKHFFTLLGKMFFTPYGKEFFTYLGKQIFTS